MFLLAGFPWPGKTAHETEKGWAHSFSSFKHAFEWTLFLSPLRNKTGRANKIGQ